MLKLLAHQSARLFYVNNQQFYHLQHLLLYLQVCNIFALTEKRKIFVCAYDEIFRIYGFLATATTIGGKQILLQKPLSISGQNVLQLVKTSQGIAFLFNFMYSIKKNSKANIYFFYYSNFQLSN